MAAGGPGVNPLTDILIYNLEPFDLDICMLIRILGIDEFNSFDETGIKYWNWDKDEYSDQARSLLLELYKKRKPRIKIAGRSSEEILKIATKFYSIGLSKKQYKYEYWKISKEYFELVKRKEKLKGKSLEIYEKIDS